LTRAIRDLPGKKGAPWQIYYLLSTFGVIDSSNEFPITFFVSEMFYPVSPGMVIFNPYNPSNPIFLSYNPNRSNRLSYFVNTTLIFCPYTESRAGQYGNGSFIRYSYYQVIFNYLVDLPSKRENRTMACFASLFPTQYIIYINMFL